MLYVTYTNQCYGLEKNGIFSYDIYTKQDRQYTSNDK